MKVQSSMSTFFVHKNNPTTSDCSIPTNVMNGTVTNKFQHNHQLVPGFCTSQTIYTTTLYLQILWMALSRRFSSVVISLSLGFLAWRLPLRSSSVMVILMLPGLALLLPPPDDREYLLSLLMMGEGLTRKSRRDATMAEERWGNLTASLPIAWNQRPRVHFKVAIKCLGKSTCALSNAFQTVLTSEWQEPYLILPWKIAWLTDWKYIHIWRLTISTQNNACPQSQVSSQSKNTKALRQ